MKSLITRGTINSHIIRKWMIKVLAILLVILVFTTGVLFYSFELLSYRQDLQENVDNIAFQLTANSEIILRNIRETISRSALYDADIFTLSTEDMDTRQEKSRILDFLKSLSVPNEYIHSAYLYFPNSDRIFTSHSAPVSVVTFDMFSDKSAFLDIDNKGNYISSPRLLSFSNYGKNTNRLPLAATLVNVMPAHSTSKNSYLAINIDLDILFSKLFQRMRLDDSLVFYVLGKDSIGNDSQRTVIYHKDRNRIFKQWPIPWLLQRIRMFL